tara:strand:- start:698 stop:883 length:186 start_codon:yes stop_codon:yes gene_type:complete
MPARERSARFARIATADAFFQGGAAAADTSTVMASLAHGLTGSSLMDSRVRCNTVLKQSGW